MRRGVTSELIAARIEVNYLNRSLGFQQMNELPKLEGLRHNLDSSVVIHLLLANISSEIDPFLHLFLGATKGRNHHDES